MNNKLIGNTAAGMLIAAIIAISLFELGFWKTFVVVIAMAIGALVVRIVEGRLDVRALTDVIRGRRSS
ncbi:DUF2273 domain-containing protein [Canibacter zhoujuaniae]|uniref:DUF2273 domain-containing protein n=1 Tax=Canibacter zhoujuaniae TaxID=2708343 RepID=UPI00142117D1|nr:DUF2273 domain-containing protein [Canibacter zhoujuaniae]